VSVYEFSFSESCLGLLAWNCDHDFGWFCFPVS